MVPFSRLVEPASTAAATFDPSVQQLGLFVHTATQAGQDEAFGPAREQRNLDLELALDDSPALVAVGMKLHDATAAEAVGIHLGDDVELGAVSAAVEGG